MIGETKMRLLVHTMTVTVPEEDCRIEMDFFHALLGKTKRRLIGKRMRVNRNFRNDNKMKRKLPTTPKNMKELQEMVKRNRNARIEHRVKTVEIGALINQSYVDVKESPEKSPSPSQHRTSPILAGNFDNNSQQEIETNDCDPVQLVTSSTPEQTAEWLLKNRFGNFRETFASFSGADMLRMSRDDLIQICGQVDGIRLYNSLHLKSIIPKLKIYVCRQHTSVFNAVFLLSYNNNELVEKLCQLMGIEQDQVRDIYMEGPHSIHVQINNDLIRHITDETMFSVEILKDHGRYALLLKRTIK